MIAVVLYCYSINDWEERFKRQIERVKSSGLYDGADEIYVYISDPLNNSEEKIKNILLNYPKIILHYTTINHGEGYRAICKVDELGKQNDNYKILYFHTKGVFNKYKNFVNQEIDDLKVKSVNCWVEMMEYFLIDNWKTCVDKLDEYDTVGVTCNGNWWWGNFWWTKSSHLKKNIPMSDFYGGSRWQAEDWLHGANNDKQNIKPYEFYKFYFDGHYSIIPKYFYDGTDISNIKINIIDAKFGYFSEQKDEGRGIQNEENKIFDVTEQIRNSVAAFDYKRIRNDWSKYDFDSIFYKTFGHTLHCTLTKSLRIKFNTNIDSENEYVVTSFLYQLLDVGYKK